MAPNITLTYFDLSGRGDSVRLSLKLAGVDFKDNRITFPDWPNEQKNVEKYPLGSMPTLDIDGKVLVQTTSILRFIGNMHNMHGDDSWQKYYVDTVLDTVCEVLALTFPPLFAPNEEAKKAAIDKATKQGLKFLDFVEKIVIQHGGPYLIGQKVTVADVLLISTMKQYEAIVSGFVEKYPGLKKLSEKLHENEVVKKFYA